jgi:CheY-like chemotaxis protein
MLRVQSKQDEGTAIDVYPAEARLPDSEGTAGSGGSGSYRHETVLLVEDDEVVRDVAADVLRHHGYMVLEAGNGLEALGVVESRADTHVDLLFTDVVMPVMNGRELASRLRDVLPDFKVLYTSGYTWEAIDRMGRSDPSGSFLEKPFTALELTQKVQAVLES